MKLLFVCTANIDRSPTGEDIYKNHPGIEAKSAGTEIAYADVPISRELIDWADIVFCMEEKHSRAVLRTQPKAAGKIAVLNILDTYYRGHPELVKAIRTRVDRFLEGQKIGTEKQTSTILNQKLTMQVIIDKLTSNLKEVEETWMNIAKLYGERASAQCELEKLASDISEVDIEREELEQSIHHYNEFSQEITNPHLLKEIKAMEEILTSKKAEISEKRKHTNLRLEAANKELCLTMKRYEEEKSKVLTLKSVRDHLLEELKKVCFDDFA